MLKMLKMLKMRIIDVKVLKYTCNIRKIITIHKMKSKVGKKRKRKKVDVMPPARFFRKTAWMRICLIPPFPKIEAVEL